MKNSTLLFFLLSLSILPAARLSASPFHTENIVLKSFTAVRTTEGAKVSWEFSSDETDINCALEKSVDGISFQPVRTVHITSTLAQAKHSYLDVSAIGQTYYRLRITKPAYVPYISPIVAVTVVRSAAIQLDNIINRVEVNSSLFGDISLSADVVHVQLIDLTGRARISQFTRGVDIDRNFRPAYGNLPSGFYILSVSSLQKETLMKKGLQKFQ